MKIITSVEGMQKFSKEMRKTGKTIGLVPTMGYLHHGHLSLVKLSKAEADLTVVSIFVNPTQFAPNEDFSKYPRDEKRDIELLIENKSDVLFMPSAEEIYPAGYQTEVEVTGITRHIEGEFRPAHFKGVTTIVSILFNAVCPDIAVFGQKDAQQAAVIRRMVKDLKFGIRIIVSPIIREADGLALSSRNIFLSGQERSDALVLSQSLSLAEKMILQGERDSSNVIKAMEALINKAASASLDYIRIVESDSFEENLTLSEKTGYYVLIACRIGRTRLIDNMHIKI
ncbi:MAG: pantoate--beta-alanine ligase [Methanococcaceae archaeon]